MYSAGNRCRAMRLLVAIQQRCGLVLAIAALTCLLVLWLSLPSSPHVYILPSLTSPISIPPPIPFHSNSRLLPFRYWHHRSLFPQEYTDDSCMRLPDVSDIQYASSSWQLLGITNGSVYIYGAYWDPRFEEPLVRILVYTDVTPLPKLYCQLWFPHDNEPQTEVAEVTYGWQPAWGGPTLGVNEPYILSCRCRRHHPETKIAPVAAAVVSAPCGVATNVLNIQNAPFKAPLDLKPDVTSPHNGTTVAVCVKWLHFRTDVSVRVVEWLQLLQSFGAQKAYLYIVRLHPNTRRVLKYYEETGFAVVTEVSHPPQVSGVHQSGGAQDFLDMRRELLPLNDCLYRNIGKYDWLAVIDLDEIIVPAPEDSWAALIDREKAAALQQPDGAVFDALVFPNYFVLNGAQKDLVGPAQARMLSHTWRARSPSPQGWCVKSFFNTGTVVAMHNHSPMSCGRACNSRDMSVNDTSRMLHYRDKCADDAEDCEALHDVVRENILDRWRAPVLKEMEQVLSKLGLEPLE